ncbi:hypothetical protein OUZ56_005262 [Daphnia magna]|uniref:Uncharacterized protein n=1 Tax=Daphnia magna TaxID=35525 RepID=A0ABQ9YSA6_9CRUS|nr:hypothetical protein OUZ56_005262 [Daphnia magna]
MSSPIADIDVRPEQDGSETKEVARHQLIRVRTLHCVYSMTDTVLSYIMYTNHITARSARHHFVKRDLRETVCQPVRQVVFLFPRFATFVSDFPFGRQFLTNDPLPSVDTFRTS